MSMRRVTAGALLAGPALALTGALSTSAILLPAAGSARRSPSSAIGTAHAGRARPPAVVPATGASIVRRARRSAPPAGAPARTFVRIPGETLPALDLAGAERGLHSVAAAPSELAQPIALTFTLRRADQAGFSRLLSEVTNPRSSNFRHYLTQRQLTERFGPSADAYQSTLSWLRSQGFRLTQGSADRLTMTVTGTRGQAQRALGVRFNEYLLGGRRVYANASAPALPRSIARDVAAVSGLSNLAAPHAPAVYRADVKSACLEAALSWIPGSGSFQTMYDAARTGSATWLDMLNLMGEMSTVWAGYLNPVNMFANGWGTGNCLGVYLKYLIHTHDWNLDGRPDHLLGAKAAVKPAISAPNEGQKIGLLEFDTFRPSDVADWLALMGLPASVLEHVHEVPINGGVPVPGPGESEVLLDIAAVIDADPYLLKSPAASLVVYDASANTSFEQLFNAMIEQGDTVISNSWSACEGEVSPAEAQSINAVLEQAAARGISVFNGSGDAGGTCLDGAANTVGVPADSPYATAVGGTSPHFEAGLAYGGEEWWGEGSRDGSGGGFGVSRYFARPSYQQGFNASAMRSVPDVAVDANPEAGVEICQEDAGGCPNGQLFGGTSMAAPELAGATAYLNPEIGQNIGFANPVLYQLARSDPATFHSAASMHSDFAHVGLGSPVYDNILRDVTEEATGPTSAGESHVAAAIDVPADGRTDGIVRVEVLDENGFPEVGHNVTVTPSPGSHAVISAPSGPSNGEGFVTFDVTDTVAEEVKLTITDTTDNVTLSSEPTMTFVEPVATGAQISAGPTTVNDNGSATTTISVYLQNGLGRPAVGKTVKIAQGSGNATIAPESLEALTNDEGIATFTATDESQESVSFTATDASDGDLPVPGSATVTFEPEGASPCGSGAPTAVSPYSISPWASGFPYNAQRIYLGLFDYYACQGPEQPAFDASGNMYVPDSTSGQIFVFGSSGGRADAQDALPGAHFGVDELFGLAFGKNGELYASVPQTNDSFSEPKIVQLNPTTGAVMRVIATAASGLSPCPSAIAVDPLSGDLFVTDDCSGVGSPKDLERIADPSGSSPVVSQYTTALPYTEGIASNGIAFAPDGTIYVAMPGSRKVVSVSATNLPGSPTVSTVAGFAGEPYGVAVAESGPEGQATALDVVEGSGAVTRVDLSGSPATTSTVVSDSEALASTSAVLGPDGCVYVTNLFQLLRLSSSSGCAGPSSSAPQVTLSPGGPSPAPTGSSVTFTAQLSHFASAPGTPVIFSVGGANAQVKLVHADASGRATFTLEGVLTGADTVMASAEDGSTPVTSAPITQRWSAGKDVTSIDLNASQQGGPAGQPATITARLLDISQTPPGTISGQPVAISLDGDSCTVQTNGEGVASCQLIPPVSGLLEITASYAGSATYSESQASDLFDATLPAAPAAQPAAPVNITPPAISGTPLPGHELSCSTGAWTGSPSAFAYQWQRAGRPIAGASAARYDVQIADEAQTLTCAVSAANAAGASAPATSAGVLVAVPGTLSCPKPSGRIAGASLGPLRLGFTRKRARATLRRFRISRNGFDNFCLYGGFGISAGYPAQSLLQTLSRRQRARVRGRIVVALTANPYYALRGARPGMAFAPLSRRLHAGKAFRINGNDWYIVPGKRANGVLKVSGGVIQDVGIAERLLTTGRRAQRLSLTSWNTAQCVVPSLRGATLARARTLLRDAHCRLGRVSRPAHPRRRHALVVSAQLPRPQSVYAPGHRVRVRLSAR